MDATTLTYPPESIQCLAGDYIITQNESGSWQVFHVEDLVLLSRLTPLTFPQGVELIEERNAMDSQTPAYFREIYLLLTRFSDEFADRELAVSAVSSGTLGEPTRHLCLPIRDFKNELALVHTPS